MRSMMRRFTSRTTTRLVDIGVIVWIGWMSCVMTGGALASAAQISAQQECEIGEDGTCINANTISISNRNNNNDNQNCVDRHEKCNLWMSKGECDANPTYMLFECAKSCETCGIDRMELIKQAERRKLLYEVGGDETLLETPYGVTQSIGNGKESPAILRVIQNFTQYMETRIMADPKSTVKNTCKNRHRDCAYWTSLGECEANPTYMQKHCAVACQTCHYLDFKFRCPVNESIPEALGKGDVDKLFRRLVEDEYYQQYQPKILSQPPQPWVVVLENMLTDEECDRLIELGAVEGYRASADVGKKNFDGTYEKSVNSGRTSTNAWCNNACMADPVTRRVNERIANVTGVPEANAEYLQLLRYTEGQFYNTHHDYIPHHVDRQMGVRTLTVFLYLNDVEAGGGTEFPGLGLVVQPKKGKALIWPSVLDSDPNAKDDRTEHGALPVEAGIKYGANAWIHQRDFKETLQRGCT